MTIALNGGLEIGTVLETIDGKKVEVKKLLGEGGQGFVYLVDYNLKPKALKWYKPGKNDEDNQKFYNNLLNNKDMTSPGNEFLWPIDIVEWSNGTYGYIMDLVKEGYYPITEYVLGNVSFANFKVTCDAALKMISAFRKLHNIGYSYQDLNDGNFFINPNTGDLLIGDNDNVSPNGVDMGILGKPRYMAPEIVIGKGKVKPDTMTDLYSLSLLLFMLFTNTHALEGMKLKSCGNVDALADSLYGDKALFLLDKNDTSNGPIPGIHQNITSIWPYFPEYMKDIFYKAFSHNALLENVNYRPREIEWLENIVRFRNDIILCNNCGNSVFYKDSINSCDCCNKNLDVNFYLELDGYSIPAVRDTRIYNFHVGKTNVNDALNPIGRIVQNKVHEDLVGIANLSSLQWGAITKSGKNKIVNPKDVVPLVDGISTFINDCEIKIKYRGN